MTRKHFTLDTDTLLKRGLLFLLTAVYALVVFTIVDAVVIMTFAEARAALVNIPVWMLPLMGYFDLLDALLSILFGPSVGITLAAVRRGALPTPAHISV